MPPREPPVALPGLEELLRTSDVVSLHLPLTAATRHLIDASGLALMRPSAFLVNTSRGGIVDHAAASPLAHRDLARLSPPAGCAPSGPDRRTYRDALFGSVPK